MVYHKCMIDLMLLNGQTTALIIVTVIILLVVIPLAIVYGNKRRKEHLSGKAGEKMVSSILNDMANRYGGYVVDDVIIPSGKGKTAQIDNIYIAPNAIFVIEVKDYSGRIYGSENQKQWTQVLAYGHEKHKLYNPLMQNKTHMDSLSEIVRYPGYMVSCVVFINSNINHVDASNVFNPTGLKRFIKQVIKYNSVEYNASIYYQKIRYYKDNPIKSSEEHVSEIQHRQSLVNINFCPNCGVPLVVRHSNNGSRFYGCPNYPRCKITKRI